MALAAKYFVSSASGVFIDWSWTLTGFSVLGKEVGIVGGGAVDTVYVAAGSSVDASGLNTSGGNDVLYLTGNFADYTQTVNAFGVYTFTRTAGLPPGQTEVVKFSSGPDDDVVYFANAHVVVGSASAQPNAQAGLQDQDTGEYRLITANDLLSGGTPADVAAGLPTQGTEPTKIFVFDPSGLDVPQLPVAGQSAIVSGGGGVDSYYVKAGTSATATGLTTSGGADNLYLTGNFTDYTQTVDAFGVYTFTRTAGLLPGQTEVVKFSSGPDDDVVYFANGSVVVGSASVQLNAQTNLQNEDTGEFRLITLSDFVADSTPGLSDIQSIAITSVPGADNTYVEGDAIEFTVTMKSAVTIVGSPVFSFTIGSTPATATLDTINSTATLLKFKYTVLATQTDTDGISYDANALTGGTITITAGGAAAKITHGALGNQVGHMVDAVAPATPSLALATDSGTNAADGITNIATVNVTGIESGATWQYQVDGGAWQAGTGTSFNLTSGAHSYAVRQSDAAGNATAASSNYRYDLDSAAPAPVVGVPGPVSAAGVVATVTAESGSAIVVTISSSGSGNTVSKTFTGTGAAQNISLDAAELSSLGVGTLTLSAVATDAAGNSNTTTPATSSVVYSITPPAAPTIVVNAITALSADTGIAADFITKTAEQTISGSFTGAIGTDAVQVSIDGGATWSANATISGQSWSVAGLTLPAAGTSILTRAISAEGGTALGASRTYTLDTTLPSDPVVALLNPSITAVSAAAGVASVTAEAGSKLVVTFTQGSNTLTKTLVGTGAPQTIALLTAELNALGNGTITISAVATDAAGNASNPGTASASYPVTPPPGASGHRQCHHYPQC